jgi:hypothetical protein
MIIIIRINLVVALKMYVIYDKKYIHVIPYCKISICKITIMYLYGGICVYLNS